MTRIAIIGGGIGGLTAARALSLRGLEVDVYESAPELKEIGAGVDLGPNAMKVMRSLGLEQAIRDIGWENEKRIWRHWRTGKIVSSIDPGEVAQRYGATACSIHRADLLDVLAAALPSKVKVTLGARCVAVAQDGDSAYAEFADGTSVLADVVIGADGIHSAVRTSMFGPDSARFTGRICYRTVIPVDALTNGREIRDSGNSRGPHGLYVLYGLRRGELINAACHFDEDTFSSESWNTKCDQQEIVDRYQGWHESFLRIFEADSTWYKWGLFDRDPIQQWSRGTVSLLGDAAHPMLPYLGQGASQAIEDGVVLAAALAETPSDPAGALELYERVRKPRANRIVTAARARANLNHTDSRARAWQRDTLIALRKRFTSDPGGRGDSWIGDYDASSPSVLQS